uniref:Secreted protein n=1 Tax=Opuntia streptacantha TaxID=393608 RepID=A0A7C9DG72_OPUST
MCSSLSRTLVQLVFDLCLVSLLPLSPNSSSSSCCLVVPAHDFLNKSPQMVAVPLPPSLDVKDRPNEDGQPDRKSNFSTPQHPLHLTLGTPTRSVRRHWWCHTRTLPTSGTRGQGWPI